MKHKSSKHQTSLKGRIKKACEGLVNVSETDAPIELFFNSSMEEPSAKELLRVIDRQGESATESTDLDDFFKRLTSAKEWHTKEQSRNVLKFKKLQQLLEKELDGLCVIRIGKIRVETYAIGRSKNDGIVGIKTFSVET
jgi:hypothetical protein